MNSGMCRFVQVLFSITLSLNLQGTLNKNSNMVKMAPIGSCSSRDRLVFAYVGYVQKFRRIRGGSDPHRDNCDQDQDERDMNSEELLETAANAGSGKRNAALEDVIADLERRNQGNGFGLMDILSAGLNSSSAPEIFKTHEEIFEDCNPLRFVDADPQKQEELRKLLHEEIQVRGVGGVDESEEELEELEERMMTGEFDHEQAGPPDIRADRQSRPDHNQPESQEVHRKASVQIACVCMYVGI